MASVASESTAVPPSRTPLPSLRNQADANRGEASTPFSDLLDSASAPSDPPPPPAPPPARADGPGPDRAPDSPPSSDSKKPASKDAAASGPEKAQASDPKPSDAKSTDAPDDKTADNTTGKPADDANPKKAGKTGKTSGIVKLTLAKDVAPSADKGDAAKPDADPNAVIAAPVVQTAPTPVPQVSLVAALGAGQVATAAGHADASGADTLSAIAAAAGQGQPASAGAAKPATASLEKQGSADAKLAATADVQATVTPVDPTKDGQPHSNGDKPATPFHQTVADLLAKTDGAAAPAIGNAGTAAAASADAVQSLAAAAPLNAPPATTAANPVAATATSVQVQAQAQAQAAAVPLSGLAVEISSQAKAGTNHFAIRLDPPELGRIDVKLNVDRDGNVSTHLVVDRSDTLDLLKRDAPTLERALQQAGLKTADHGLDFSLRQHAFAHDDTPAQTNSSRLIVSDDDPAPLEAMRQGYGRLLGLGGGLDIRV